MESPEFYDGYTAFMLVATAWVLMMTVPALALFYGGMSRSKSVLNMMMMSVSSVAVVGIVYVLWGWSMTWGSGQLLGGLFANPFEMFALEGVEPGSYVAVVFQMTFAIITAALISGAIADRVKFSAWLVFLPLWITLSYLPLAHMVWNLGFIAENFEAQDYAGGTVVHINAGVAGGVLALIIGKRIGFGKDPMRPHNLVLTMIGAGLLWFGWYGFNVGSIVFGADNTAEQNAEQFMTETGITFLNTTIATMAAIIGWLLVEKILHGKVSALGAASGIVAGLVAITPACAAVDVYGALAIGAISGAACAWAVGLKYKFGLDDSLDVIGVHLVGGIIGTVLIGLFSTTASAGTVDGLFYGGGFKSLYVQFMAALIAIVWSGVMTTIIALAIKATIGWRVSEEDEVNGIDTAVHGESAYDMAGSSGSHL